VNARRKWDAWLRTRPAIIRVLGRRFKPWHRYRIKATGQTCVVQAFSENGTIRVYAWHDWSGPMLGNGVFGLKPNDLERATEPQQSRDSLGDQP
jgi:hypothetical protein